MKVNRNSETPYLMKRKSNNADIYGSRHDKNLVAVGECETNSTFIGMMTTAGFNAQLNELKQMKIDLEKQKKEFIMLQTKYHQRLSAYETKFEQLRSQARKIQQEQDEKETNLLNATAEWRDIQTKLESSAMSSGEKVKLNVGGRYYQTTIRTLTKHSEGTSSYFKALFSRQWQLQKDPKDESVFIDRDGDLFGFILQYLRTGKISIDFDYDLLRQDLMMEAEFYNLHILVNLLNANPSKKEDDTKRNSQSDSKKLYLDTKILSINDQQELNKFSGYDHQQWQLIYRASRDGYTAKAFHQICDGCSPTICVIRSNHGFIFGGFTSIPWSSTTADKTDTSAFLFTLKNPFGIKPTKYPIRERAVEHAVSHHPDAGPTFGSAQHGGVDLLLQSPFDVERSRTFFPQSYQDTTKKYRYTFNGNPHFSCDDVEIFTLI
jgi:hypothetical protein